MDVSFYIENGIRCANCFDYIGKKDQTLHPRLCIKCACDGEDHYKKVTHVYDRYDRTGDMIDIKFD